MELKEKQPLDFSMLKVERIDTLGEVISKDIFEPNNTLFKMDGLFSTEIFGEVGTSERMDSFGYINLNTKTMHPFLFRAITKSSVFYTDILKGNEYVVFDNKLKDFVISDSSESGTGIAFFMKHFEQLKLRDTDSVDRKELNKLLKDQSIDTLYISKFLVLPAGMRDYHVTEEGKVLEDAINNSYRKLLTTVTVAKQFKDENVKGEFYNSIVFRLANNLLEIYEYIENILDDKHGFIQGKWLKRRIAYGSANVFTSSPIKIKDLTDDNNPSFNNSIIGLYQYLKTILPIAIYKTQSTLLANVFNREISNTYLYNMDTYKKELVTLSEKSRSIWVTDNGLEDTINKMLDDKFKDNAVIIDNHYLFLVIDKKDTITFIDDINNIPEEYSIKDVRALTYSELFFISIYDTIGDYAGFITRYPIDGLGSIYPAISYVKTTSKGRTVKLVGVPSKGNMDKVKEYPILGSTYFNSMSVHGSHLVSLGLDFDGDKGNNTQVWSEEGNKDIKDLLASREYYVSITGKINFSSNDNISKLAFRAMTVNDPK